MAVTKINAKQIDAFSGSSASELEVQRDMDLNSNNIDGVGQLTASYGLVQNDMVIQGNLTVAGDQLIANVSILEVEDLAIRAAKNATSSAQADGAGLQIGQSGSQVASITWDHANQEWAVDAALSASSLQGVIDAASLGDVDTDALAEGSTNLYYTNARVHAALSMEANRFITYDGSGAFAMDEALFSGSSRGLISVTDSGGDGSLAYDASTGVITYTGPSAAEVRAHFVGGDALTLTDGTFDVNVDDSSIEVASDSLQVKAGGITNAMLSGAIASSKLAELNAFDTDDLSEGSSNLYYTDARARAAISEDADILDYDSGTGVLSVVAANVTASARSSVSADATAGEFLSYAGATGVFSVDNASFSGSVGNAVGDAALASAVRTHFSAADFVTYDSGTGVVSVSAALFTGSARSTVSVPGTDALAYDGATGVFSLSQAGFTGSVRSAITVADSNSVDLTYSGGQIEADVILSGSSLVIDSNGLSLQLSASQQSFEAHAQGLKLASTVAGTGLSLSADGILSVDDASAPAAAIDVANDTFKFNDNSDSDTAKTESVADLMTAVAGDGILAASGVLALDMVEEVKGQGDFTGLDVSIGNAPAPAASLAVYLNGQLLQAGSGNDYTISGTTITLDDAALALDADDVMIIRYTK